jgi:hypothetical protein
MMLRRVSRISDEEMDWAIRAALRAETEDLEPSPEVWQRVRARIENPALDSRQRRTPILWTRRAASVLQGAVLAVLVLGIGVTFNQRLHGSGLAYPVAPDVVYASPARASAQYPDDMLSMGRIAQIAQRPEPGYWRLPR